MARRRRSLLKSGGPRDAAPADEHEEQAELEESSASAGEPVAEPEAAEPEVSADPPPSPIDELDLLGDPEEIPHSGDPDSYAEAETQMDEFGMPDSPFDDAHIVEEMGGAATPRYDDPDAATVDDPGPDYADAPVEGLLDDDPGLYEGFSDLENPPTEEVPLFQDVSQPHNAPMNVPEPPPIPGIEDRFTPPPVERTELGSRHSGERPSYLATPTPAPRERGTYPQQEAKPAAPAPAQDEEDEEEFAEPPGMLRWVAAAGVIAFLGLLAWGLTWLNSGEDIPAGTIDATEDHGVDVKKGIQKDAPEILGDLDGVDDPDRREGAGGAIVIDADGNPATPAPEPDGQPAPAPEPTPAPAAAPAVAPAPAPAPKPKPKPKATTSKLSIRANRRVLVYVDGKAAGYTPIDYDVGPGGHEIMAMIPGKPDSRQTQSASAPDDGGSTTVKFTF